MGLDQLHHFIWMEGKVKGHIPPLSVKRDKGGSACKDLASGARAAQGLLGSGTEEVPGF